MPAGVKPINCVGKKGRSGRKCYKDETAKFEAIAKAWEKVNRKLDRLKEQEIKEIALPIALRDMSEKVDLTSNKKELKALTYEQKNEIAKRLLQRRGITDIK